ncbi:hypothetical protein B0A52_02001 [Exophiala mesophila]|uniref:Exoribonuclease phosphorolytic domain-containing protein n=1 Tax=Exophiala mesophila TaxID=212818 RepID=A0A438NEL0_EXOME|nr:hypothetical protein B0A52_02001 [Exophiala mesophila]
MTDRRRIVGPPGATNPPVFTVAPQQHKPTQQQRQRKPNELRKIFLQTGVVPSASGSAYLELETPPHYKTAFPSPPSTIKLSCTLHGPKPLPRTATFSSNLQLTASVKFAPFATRIRQGYVRNSTEKDLGLHLENALKGAIIPERWPKSAFDIAVIVLEGEEDPGNGDRITGVGLFNMLAGCINVAMAAIADARIDSLDLLCAGVGAIVSGPLKKPFRVLDPVVAEHDEVLSTCMVAYLPSRDEVVEMWTNGAVPAQGIDGGLGFDELVDSAVAAARGAQTVLKDVLLESSSHGQVQTKKSINTGTTDIEMRT